MEEPNPLFGDEIYFKIHFQSRKSLGDKSLIQATKEILKAFENSHVVDKDNNVTLYKGVFDLHDVPHFKFCIKLLNGSDEKFTTLETLTSTTTDESGTKEFMDRAPSWMAGERDPSAAKGLVKIHIPSGKILPALAPWYDTYNHEQEILLPPGLILRCDDDMNEIKNGGTRNILNFTVVDPLPSSA